MEKNFDENFNILQKEIYDITKNIDKVQKKNHQTMSKSYKIISRTSRTSKNMLRTYEDPNHPRTC